MIKIKWDKEHFKGVVIVMTYTFLAGVFITASDPLVRGIAILYLILGVGYEYMFLALMDTREDVALTKKQLSEYISRAMELKKEIEGMRDETVETKNEIERMKDKIFNVFSKRGFKTVEERLKDLEEAVGVSGYGRNYGDSLKNEVAHLKLLIKEIREKIGMRGFF